MAEPSMCPVCGCKPVVRYVGDYKQFFILQCPYCGYIAAKIDEARSSKRDAIKVWNRGRDNGKVQESNGRTNEDVQGNQ